MLDSVSLASKQDSLFMRWAAWALPSLLYAAVSAVAIYAARDGINPDTISYIQNARYLVEGRLADSVSGYWSPLFSWSMAPLVALGCEPVLAARLALAAWGWLIIPAGDWLARSIGSTGGLRRVATNGSLALISATYTQRYFSPDTILAVCLVAYLAIGAQGLLQARWRAVACGLLTGVGFLAKSYALPYFVVHFPLTLAWEWWFQDRRAPISRVVLRGLQGVLAFAIVAGPWIAALSHKFGEFTVSTSARLNHSVIGPSDKPRYHPVWRGLQRPRPDRLTLWEVPEDLEYNHWSPLESTAYFRHQVLYTALTSLVVVGDVARCDLFRLTLPAFLVAPLLLAGPRTRRGFATATWIGLSLAIFAGGFTLVFYTVRYIELLAWTTASVFVLAFCVPWFGELAARLRLRRWAPLAFSLLAVTSFAFDACYRSARYLVAGNARHVGTLRRPAKELLSLAGPGPIAVSPNLKHDGMYLAFFCNQPYHGHPTETDPAAIDASLAQFDVRTFVVSSAWPLAESFRRGTHWRLLGEVERDTQLTSMRLDDERTVRTASWLIPVIEAVAARSVIDLEPADATRDRQTWYIYGPPEPPAQPTR